MARADDDFKRLLREKDQIIHRQARRIRELEKMPLTRLYRVLLFFQLTFYAPVVRFFRTLLGKSHQFIQVVRGKRRHPWLSVNAAAYRRWTEENDPSPEELDHYSQQGKNFKYRPLISIVVPVYNTDRQWIEKAVESVIAQVYDNWELCLANDGSTAPHVRPTLDECARKDKRVKVTHLPENRGISGATNAALEIASGEFIAFMDSDDELPPVALYEMVAFLNEHPEADVIFSDEDKLSLEGQREKPEFKPGWSPQLFLTYNYINHLTICRKALVDTVGRFRPEFNWSQDYDLYLRVTEQTDNIYHIPKILYHWRSIPGSSAAKVDTRPKALEASRQLLEETLHRRGLEGVVKDGLRPGTFKVKIINKKGTGKPQ